MDDDTAMRNTIGKLASSAALRLLRVATAGRGLAASVVMVTRDRASYLELTLATLDKQTLPVHDWELIIVDRGSLVGTTDVLDRCAARGRIHLSVHTVDRSLT